MKIHKEIKDDRNSLKNKSKPNKNKGLKFEKKENYKDKKRRNLISKKDSKDSFKETKRESKGNNTNLKNSKAEFKTKTIKVSSIPMVTLNFSNCPNLINNKGNKDRLNKKIAIIEDAIKMIRFVSLEDNRSKHYN